MGEHGIEQLADGPAGIVERAVETIAGQVAQLGGVHVGRKRATRRALGRLHADLAAVRR